MANDPKAAQPQTSSKQGDAAPHRKPWVGASVHYFDESRAGAYARMGVGPYAAIVTCLDIGGVSLFVIGPQGGRFDVEKVAYKGELRDAPGKKRWWDWPARG